MLEYGFELAEDVGIWFRGGGRCLNMVLSWRKMLEFGFELVEDFYKMVSSWRKMFEYGFELAEDVEIWFRIGGRFS